MSLEGVGLLLQCCHDVVGEVEEEIMILMIFGILSSEKEKMSDKEGEAPPMMMPMMIETGCFIYATERRPTILLIPPNYCHCSRTVPSHSISNSSANVETTASNYDSPALFKCVLCE